MGETKISTRLTGTGRYQQKVFTNALPQKTHDRMDCREHGGMLDQLPSDREKEQHRNEKPTSATQKVDAPEHPHTTSLITTPPQHYRGNTGERRSW